MPVDLTPLAWSLSGWRPYAWKHARSIETTFWLEADIAPVPARLPGSVQQNLRNAGLIGDWNIGFGTRDIEWIEHRHWVFSTPVPAGLPAQGERLFLRAESLDYSGWILVDGRPAGTFEGPHRPTVVELTDLLADRSVEHTLGIVFDTPPEAFGQIGYTSRTRFLKPRYHYSWDWCPRLVSMGAKGALALCTGSELAVEWAGAAASCDAGSDTGRVEVRLDADPTLLPEPKSALFAEVTVDSDRGPVATLPACPLVTGRNVLHLDVPSPARWYPQGFGPQALYTLRVRVMHSDGTVLREFTRTTGFKHVAWKPCEGAPAGALPWICEVNGRPVFLQGVNWTPPRLAYQDTTDEEIDRLVGLYRLMGCNLLRVWGGAYLESESFYHACDRAGILVWQEFPLSSAGLDNQPPHDPAVIAELGLIARHDIRQRRHHASLLMWCGGNELQAGLEGEKPAVATPCDLTDPCLAAFAAVAAEEDPGRRFLPTSPTGPRFGATEAEFGKGVHHHVHGPWGFGDFPEMADWERYWTGDDSLFRSEVGVAGMNDMELLLHQAGGHPLWPTTTPIWKHSAGWWTQETRLVPRFNHLPPNEAIAAASEFTRTEQAAALAFAARATKARFPRCGGFVIWMGHDCFPCPANTSVIDFHHRPKPAWHALRDVFQTPQPQ